MIVKRVEIELRLAGRDIPDTRGRTDQDRLDQAESGRLQRSLQRDLVARMGDGRLGRLQLRGPPRPAAHICRDGAGPAGHRRSRRDPQALAASPFARAGSAALNSTSTRAIRRLPSSDSAPLAATTRRSAASADRSCAASCGSNAGSAATARS